MHDIWPIQNSYNSYALNFYSLHILGDYGGGYDGGNDYGGGDDYGGGGDFGGGDFGGGDFGGGGDF